MGPRKALLGLPVGKIIPSHLRSTSSGSAKSKADSGDQYDPRLPGARAAGLPALLPRGRSLAPSGACDRRSLDLQAVAPLPEGGRAPTSPSPSPRPRRSVTGLRMSRPLPLLRPLLHTLIMLKILRGKSALRHNFSEGYGGATRRAEAIQHTQSPQALLIIPAALLMRRRSPVDLYIRVNAWLWKRLPSNLRNTRPMRWYGTILHRLVSRRADRRQFTGTFFFRNRPELELMRRLAGQKPHGATLDIAVLGCSIGAEIYSISSTIVRRNRTNVRMSAVDNSAEVLKVAQEAAYTISNL